MARRVDQVQHIVLAVAGLVIEPHGLRLDGDAALALDVHRVEHLLAPDHFALGEAAGELDQPVGERRLAVIDMRDDGEVADVVDGPGGHVARGLASALQCYKQWRPKVQSPSLPGLTRQSSGHSAADRGSLDARVKPGHEGKKNIASYSAATRSGTGIGRSSTGLPSAATMTWPEGTCFQKSCSRSSGSDTMTA